MAYEDVNFTREKMKDALSPLMGPTQKLKKRTARSEFMHQPDYLADAKKRLLKAAVARQKEKEAREAREQAAREVEFENAQWRL